MRMVTVVLLALGMTVMVTMTASALVGPKLYQIEELSAAPIIDGDGSDAAWSALAATQMSDAHTADTDTATTAADQSGTFKAGWVGDTLYLLVEMTDDVMNSANAASYMQDSVEVCFDLQDREAAASAGPAEWEGHGGPIQVRCQADTTGGFTPLMNCGQDFADFGSNGSYAVVIAGTAHTYEIAMTATSAALSEAGAADLGDITGDFGFLLAVNDADDSGSRETQLWWHGGGELAPGEYNTPRSIAGWTGSNSGDWGAARFVSAGEGGLVDFSGGEGEGEGEGAAECFDTTLAEFDASGITLWTIVGPGEAYYYDEGDHPGNGMVDAWEFALLAEAICDNPDVLAVYEANYAVVSAGTIFDTSLIEFATAQCTISQAGIDALVPDPDWGLPAGGAGLAPYTGGSKAVGEPLSPEGDYDDDGETNLEEYVSTLGGGGTREDYALAASGGGGGEGEDTCYSLQLDEIDASGLTLWTVYIGLPAAFYYDDGDHPGNGMVDAWEFALLAKTICDNPDVRAAYEANYAVVSAGAIFDTSLIEFATAQCTISQAGIDALAPDPDWGLPPDGAGLAPYTGGSKAVGEPLSPEGDYDGDGYANFDEYVWTLDVGGTREDYAFAASGGISGPSVPGAGLLALGLLMGGCALAGTRTLRRK